MFVLLLHEMSYKLVFNYDHRLIKTNIIAFNYEHRLRQI